ncbi:MAG: class II fructose-bisphosphate aldolase, partial [Spirochaetota bacterium]
SAAEAERSPVILQVWYKDLEHISARYFGSAAKLAAEETSVPFALQLDHGQNIEQIRECIRWGFSSVMIDLSSLNYQENVAQTKKIVEEAHSQGISVEAELGKIFSGHAIVEKQTSSMTDVDQAMHFVDETGVDALAVSVGTAHGVYEYGPFIDFERLQHIIEKVKVPIVIHGGSFIPEQDVKKMIRLGVAKINIGTELMITFLQGLREMLFENNKDVPLTRVMSHAGACLEKKVREKINLLTAFRTDK